MIGASVATVAARISSSWESDLRTVRPYQRFYGSNFASFCATDMFLGVLKRGGQAAPIFHIARPIFLRESSRKVGESSDLGQKMIKNDRFFTKIDPKII